MLRLLRESISTTWLILPRGMWLLPLTGFFYSFFLLALNFDRGLDITDESYYLLWASHPEDFASQVTRFGHYTGILYSLVDGDLALFRLSGLFVLLTVAGFFAISLDAYWRRLMPLSRRPRWLSIPLVLSSTLIYYGVYPLWTPSYNWLVLCSTFLVATGLLQAATSAGVSNFSTSHNLRLIGHGVLVGTGGALAFIAKPTSAAALALICMFWVVVTDVRHKWAVFLSASAISSVLFLMMHAFSFENGLDWFAQTGNALELHNELSGGDYPEAVLNRFIELIKTPWRASRNTWVAVILLFGLLVGAGIRGRRRLRFERILIIGLASAGIISWLQLWRAGFWRGGAGHGASIGIGVLSFSFILASSAVISHVFFQARDRETPPLGELGTLYLFLISLPLAYSFGSSQALIRGSSAAFVFYSAATVSCAFWIDSRTGKRLFGHAAQLLIILTVALFVRSCLENPYRLAGTIYDQTVPVTVVGGESQFFVDQATADYIVGLQRMALDADWEQGTHLIDLTGGSPGAVVVLDGRAPAVPWLLGGYEGSDRFALAALSLVSQTVLENAWILSAPAGRTSISDAVLSDLGLDFPNSYESLGTVTSGHRNEEQVLWRPID